MKTKNVQVPTHVNAPLEKMILNFSLQIRMQELLRQYEEMFLKMICAS